MQAGFRASDFTSDIEFPFERVNQHASAFFVEHPHAPDMSLKMALVDEFC